MKYKVNYKHYRKISGERWGYETPPTTNSIQRIVDAPDLESAVRKAKGRQRHVQILKVERLDNGKVYSAEQLADVGIQVSYGKFVEEAKWLRIVDHVKAMSDKQVLTAWDGIVVNYPPDEIDRDSFTILVRSELEKRNLPVRPYR